MYGQWVTVNMGEGFEVRVWVSCTPNTSKYELQMRAKEKLLRQLGVSNGNISESLRAIEQHEYENGYGQRYELEQWLNEQINNNIKEMNK